MSIKLLWFYFCFRVAECLVFFSWSQMFQCFRHSATSPEVPCLNSDTNCKAVYHWTGDVATRYSSRKGCKQNNVSLFPQLERITFFSLWTWIRSRKQLTLTIECVFVCGLRVGADVELSFPGMTYETMFKSREKFCPSSAAITRVC